MKVELKNVKIASHLSEETTAFTATIYLSGKKAGTVRNDGNGGCNLYLWTEQPEKGKEFEKWARSLPPIATEYGLLPMNADLYVAELLEEYDFQRTVKKYTRKGYIVFRCTDDDAGEFSYVSPPVGKISETEKLIRSEYPNLEKIFLPPQK